jgi:hypothetical protein
LATTAASPPESCEARHVAVVDAGCQFAIYNPDVVFVLQNPLSFEVEDRSPVSGLVG